MKKILLISCALVILPIHAIASDAVLRASSATKEERDFKSNLGWGIHLPACWYVEDAINEQSPDSMKKEGIDNSDWVFINRSEDCANSHVLMDPASLDIHRAKRENSAAEEARQLAKHFSSSVVQTSISGMPAYRINTKNHDFVEMENGAWLYEITVVHAIGADPEVELANKQLEKILLTFQIK